jgi:hypothetical protein
MTLEEAMTEAQRRLAEQRAMVAQIIYDDEVVSAIAEAERIIKGDTNS